MKEYIETLNDFFTDFRGNVHHFTLAAISTMIPEYEYDDGRLIECSASVKGIKLGIAICNPTDTYSEDLGIAKAIKRAKCNPSYAFTTSHPGYINTKVVKAFLEQEAEYIKNFPERYIKGYKESKDRWELSKSMDKLEESFSSTEKEIIKELRKDSKFLDNINKYWEWLKKQIANGLK